MGAIVAADDDGKARNAVAIAIDPRSRTRATRKLDDAALAYEARFVAIEDSKHATAADAIHVARDLRARMAGDAKTGIRAAIVHSPPSRAGTDVTRDAPQPAGHRNVDERTQGAVDE